jgi:hypothetical protein
MDTVAGVKLKANTTHTHSMVLWLGVGGWLNKGHVVDRWGGWIRQRRGIWKHIERGYTYGNIGKE